MYPLFICAWCMPAGIPGTHGICPKCLDKALSEIPENYDADTALEEYSAQLNS